MCIYKYSYRMTSKITKTKTIVPKADTKADTKMDILSISMRPKTLDDIVGSSTIIDTLKKQFSSKRIPHFYLICGQSGSGKTTLSRIIAMMLQNANIEDPIHKYDIKEINASDKNGIDDIRDIIDKSNYKPLYPSIAKVIIMDEAHQLTTPAQNALLKITEDPPKSMYFIFCTTNESKIITSLRRRAYIIHTQGLDPKDINKLLVNAKNKVNSDIDIKPLEETIIKYDIDSPGIILQAAEKYFNGSDPVDCVFIRSNIELDSRKLCNLLSEGDWKKSLVILKIMKKEDIVMIKNYVLGYFKVVLLSGSDKSIGLAKAMKIIGEETYDLPIFLANLCIACEIIRS